MANDTVNSCSGKCPHAGRSHRFLSLPLFTGERTMNLLCPYLKTHVELTDERKAHIREKPRTSCPRYRDYLVQTLADPDEVRTDTRFPNSLLFPHWFPNVKGGKFIVVVVVADPLPGDRHWIVRPMSLDNFLEGL